VSLLIDSSLWVDYFRARTAARIKQLVAPFINSPEAVLCEPIRFEILRASFRNERTAINAVFATLPLLQTPADLWQNAAELGNKCADAGFSPPAMDLLIAQLAFAHRTDLVTFDSHFADIARVLGALKVQLLERA
jgi:predicted nucleic acid-binding protein